MSEEDFDLTSEDEIEDIESEDEDIEEENLAEDPAPEKELIVDDPYDWFQCQITVAITWLPVDGHDMGRQVIIAGRTHEDDPVIRSYREGDLFLEDAIGDIRHELEMSLAEREKEYLARKEEAKKQKTLTRTVPRSPSYTPLPTYPRGLLNNDDALVSLNTSKKLLEMLEKLKRAGDNGLDYKNFVKTYKSQWVLEWSYMKYINLDDPDHKDRVLIGEKGEATYQAAMDWESIKEQPPEQTKQEKKDDVAKQQIGLF